MNIRLSGRLAYIGLSNYIYSIEKLIREKFARSKHSHLWFRETKTYKKKTFVSNFRKFSMFSFFQYLASYNQLLHMFLNASTVMELIAVTSPLFYDSLSSYWKYHWSICKDDPYSARNFTLRAIWSKDNSTETRKLP